MGVYPSENFTDDEAAVLRPYFTNLDRPVFALVNLPEVVKGALFARVLAHAQEPAPPLPRRVRQRPRPHRRPHRRRDHRAAARRGALRPRVPRVRRRLRRAARWRAPRVRAVVEPAHQDPRVGPPHGVPRAVDALHRVRQEARRPLPLLPRHARCSRRASTRGATSPTWTRSSTTYAEMLPHAHRLGARALPEGSAATPTSSTSRRSRRRRATRSAASCPRPRCRTSASTAPVRVTRRCCCACARTRCPRRAATRR